MITVVLVACCVVLQIGAFIAGFLSALFFAKKVFSFYKRDQNIKDNTFPFLAPLKEKGLTKQEQERLLKHAKTEWEQKSKNYMKEHI